MVVQLATDGGSTFPWKLLESIVGGRSALDVPRLEVQSVDDAERFLSAYGYVFSDPVDVDELDGLRVEAIDFIETVLLSDYQVVPPDIRNERDVRQLLLHASTRDSDPTQRWSCALLRVMHVFAHAGTYLGDRHRHQIQSQIHSRFVAHLRDTRSGLVLGDIPVADFTFRPAKSRNAVAIKLLHKAENSAAEIFDFVGLRIVTHERFDALLVVRHLRRENVIMFANINCSRSRNTLIDLHAVRPDIDGLDRMRASGLIGPSEWLAGVRVAVRERPPPVDVVRSRNPHSAHSYHSIQFTCRQRVRVREPDGARAAFFFPYEIQIMDQQSYEASRTGHASHEAYKRRQLDDVRRRVFG